MSDTTPITNNPPKISVLMSVYNGEAYLDAAIQSILEQSFEDFEFIIINDASTDKTAEILGAYTDRRIRVLQQASNVGLTRSLNWGLQEVRGTYVARMDADDVAFPERLLVQLEILEANADILLLGGGHVEFYDNLSEGWQANRGGQGVEEMSFEDLLKNNSLCHSSVLFRRALVEEGLTYREAFTRAQDYDLWLRVALKGRVAKLRRHVCMFRRCVDSISLSYTIEQRRMAECARVLIVERVESGTDFLDAQGCLPVLEGVHEARVRRGSCEILVEFAQMMWRRGEWLIACGMLFRSMAFAPFLTVRVLGAQWKASRFSKEPK